MGFDTPDEFFMTIENFVATSGQTIFSVTRAGNYIQNQCLVFENGCLLDISEYTDNITDITLNTGATLGDQISVVSMRAIATSASYAATYLTVLSVASNVVTWDAVNMPYQLINIGDEMTFSNTGSPTKYTVSGVDYTTQEITFTTSVTASVGSKIYSYRAASSSYPAFSRFEKDLINAGSYTPTDWQFNSGYELPYMNGTVVPDQDYDIVGNTYTNMPNIASGKLTIIQFSANNLTTPTGTPVNIIAFTASGQATYPFSFTANSLNLYANGVLLIKDLDYNIGSSNYTLTITPNNNTTVLQQQTFASAGAA